MTEKFETDKEKKVCINCQSMQRPLGRNPNDTFPCAYLGKMIANVQDSSCPNWKKWELDNFM